MAERELTVGVAGLGGVGARVAQALLAGIPGLALGAISVRDGARARALLAGFEGPIVAPEALGETCDIVLEGLPPALFRTVAEPALDQGRTFMPLSVGQLLEHWDLVERARERGARILVPTGALIGLDAVRAAREGTIESVSMVTRKPPAGLAGAPHVVANGISLDGLSEPLLLFSGSVREGVPGFPANLNVAAALSLAGIGPDRTRLEVWADPGVTRNTHTIEVEADAARFTMTIENVPSETNPRTGRITALSAIAALRRLVDPLVVGT
ncbi:aspartate dehydrogenase [Salinarimonas ramus]|uniref:L-aspartate dehydrogenase n=1 Tax=Salinarimonas ramus TaxID=690164 RepID=A0A917V6S7_9HYPH|nr:aspartate dehydrogenase [Salinarimonas ramus]GGK45614.1 putative L-aspartate dehydrogenase [Salinarimonas ramus]